MVSTHFIESVSEVDEYISLSIRGGKTYFEVEQAFARLSANSEIYAYAVERAASELKR